MRIAIQRGNGERREVVHNSIQVPAEWSSKDEDIWKFDTSVSSLRTVMFRTISSDELEKDSRLIIELIVYVKSSKKITEMCCGWCEIPVEELSRGFTHKLPIHGGSPSAEVEISDKDLRTNRSGLKLMQKMFTNGVEKRLELEVKPYTKLPYEQR